MRRGGGGSVVDLFGIIFIVRYSPDLVNKLNSILLDLSQSRNSVKKCVFKSSCKIKVCIIWQCPETSAPSAPHLKVSLFLLSSGSNARGELKALEGCRVSSKSPSRVQDGDEGVEGRIKREVFP